MSADRAIAAAPRSAAGPDSVGMQRERMRTRIREEVERAEPTDHARRSVELIVESSLRLRGETGDFVVVDERGEVRRREDGSLFGVPDLLAELRQKHPRLFRAPRQPSSPAGTVATVAVAAEQAPPVAGPRDWLDLGVKAPSPASAEGTPPPQAPARRPGRRAGALAGALARRWTAAGTETVRRAARHWRQRRALALDVAAARPSPRGAKPPSSEPQTPLMAVMPEPAHRRWLPLTAAMGTLALALAGGALVVPRLMAPGTPPAQRTAPAAAPADPATTGTVAPAAAATPGGTLRGIPEVLDTATLRLQDQVARLFGVEWARGGGDPNDLVKYLRGREVACEPSGTTEAYRCAVDGQDLSRVVLFNGGGRTTPEATPELKAAEEHARSAKLGVWARQPEARPPAAP